MPREGDVIVLEEDDARFFARQADDPGDDLLARLVGGMRLARKEDLHRAPRVAQQARQAGPVPEEEVRALVRREAPPETDRQRVEVELMRMLGAFQRQLEEFALELAVDRPELGCWNLVDGVPAAVGGIEVPPVGPDKTGQEVGDLRRDPRRHVHAVGHGADRDLVLG